MGILNQAFFISKVAIERYNMVTNNNIETAKEFMSRFIANCDQEAAECMEREARKAFEQDFPDF